LSRLALTNALILDATTHFSFVSRKIGFGQNDSILKENLLRMSISSSKTEKTPILRL